MENGLATDWLNVIEKFYSTIVDFFADTRVIIRQINITYINHLQQCPQSLVSQDIFT